MTRKKIDPALWIFLLYLIGAAVMYRLSPTITGALILGIYLSMIIMVPARFIVKIKFLNERASLVISSILVFTVLILTIFQVFPIVIEEAGKLFDTLSQENLSVAGLTSQLPDSLRNLVYNEKVAELLNEQLLKIVTAFSTYGVSLLNTVIQGIPNFVTALVIFLIAATYLSSQKTVFKKNLWRFFPSSSSAKSLRFVSNYYGSIKAFISGQLIIALVVGLIVGIGMSIAGIPYAVFMGFLAGVTNFIPFFGVIITAVPAIFLGLANYGLWGLFRVGIVLIIANQIESWVLSPKIQGDRMELNWFVILLGILLFGGLFGIIGILFAVPIMVFIKEFWISYVQEAFKRT
jgi:predicted PurR-regulated permease PerM